MAEIYVFDLGGVLINLNVSRCMHDFEVLMGEENMCTILGMDKQGEGVKAVSVATKQLMADFERGMVSAEAFVQEVLRYCKPGTVAEQVIQAWMAMLDDLPQERLAVVESLRKKGHPVYLLSNGNDLHFDYINATYGLTARFDRCFLSHKMHMAKPEAAIFQAVDSAIRPSQAEPRPEVIFIDDIEANRLAAQHFVGWHTYPGIFSDIL